MLLEPQKCRGTTDFSTRLQAELVHLAALLACSAIGQAVS